MKKTTGKVLSLVLSLALVLTSFSAMFVSASTHHTVSGTLTDDPDQDTFYLVNGGTGDELKVNAFENKIYEGSVPLETSDHQEASDVEISSISHVSGDRVAKWDIDDDGAVKLSLRSASSEGKEVIAVLYKGTYTDDDDNDVTVKATTNITIHAIDKDTAVVGEVKNTTDGDVKKAKKSIELDSDFDAKTAKSEKSGLQADTDSKELAAFKAEPTANETGKTTGGSALATWEQLSTVSDTTSKDVVNADGNKVYYTLKSSNDDITLANSGTDGVPAATIDGDDAATTTHAAFAVTTSGVTVTPIAPTSPAYTYVYTTDNNAPTKDSAKVADGKIDLATAITADAALGTPTGEVIVKVAALKDSAIVTGSTVTATYTIAVADPAADAKLDATYDASTTLPGVKIDSDTGTVLDLTPVKGEATDYDYRYTLDGSTPVATSAKVEANKIDIPEENLDVHHQATVKVAAFKKGTTDVVEGSTVATCTYTASHSSSTVGDGTVIATVKTNASTGNVTFTAKITDFGEDSKELKNTKDVKVKDKIAKTIKVTSNEIKFNKLGKDHGKTYLYSSGLDTDNVTDTDKIRDIHKINVSGYEVNFDGCSNMDVTVGDKANVTKISGKLKSLAITEGNVSKVELDAGNVTVDDAKAGDIKTKDGTIKISSNATAGNLVVENDATSDAKVDIESGKVGTITSDGTVDLDATDDEYGITAGNISADGNIDIDSEDSKISVGTIKSTDNNATITLKGDNVSVKAFDFDYRDATLECDDFQGKIPAPKNASNEGATFTTNDENAKVTINGDIDIDAISIDDESKVTFDGKVKVQDIDGAGTMVVKAGDLYVGNSAADTILKLSDAKLAKGQTVLTAANDCVDTDDFTPYGFTLAKSEGKKIDTFKVDSLKFAGVAINKVESKIAKGYNETFKASAYPGGISLPTGYTIEWDLQDNDGVFELVKNADGSATVKCVDYDTTFSEENKATLVAKLIDASGDEDEDYDEAECALTAIAVPTTTANSDTTGNLNVEFGKTYKFKITSLVATAPTFTVGSGDFKVTAAGKSGNDYFYKITAVGKIGNEVGVYVNGNRVAVAKITAPKAGVVTVDTGAKLTVKAGKTYQFKVTSSANVTFGVGNGSVFQVVKSTKTGNNNYYMIKAVGKAKASTGIYINGVRHTIATVA